MESYMQALNRAIERAFIHSDGDNIDELFACMGEEMECKRISIFEENEEGFCDNAYEWCAPGVVKERILLQHIGVEKFDTWHDRLVNREIIVVHQPEALKVSDPDVYEMFIDQQIHTAIVALLAFHNRNYGFCILEDPEQTVMADAQLIMPGIRYILSSMIYSRNLVARLKRLSYIDTLTGVGNRVSLLEYLKGIDHARSVSAIAVDVIGWDNDEGKLKHLEKEQTLMRSGEVLTNLFDSEHVFRMTTGEFMILGNGVEEDAFAQNLRSIRGLFREHNLLAAVVGEWHPHAPESMDEFIHALHGKAVDEKRALLAHRNQAERQTGEPLAPHEKAVIDLPRGDAFFRIADRFLSDLYEEATMAIVTDINYFKLYNDIFGRKAGNRFLETIAAMVLEAAQRYKGVCGYMGGDNFCLIVPTRKRTQRELLPAIEAFYEALEFPDGFSPAMGVYWSDDRRESTITMYDRALAALSEIKGDYIHHIHFYSAESQRHQREDKLLLMEVKDGLARGEFLFYIQPQVHEKTGRIIGGEALVRWHHDGQLISPGRFIPVLEKTGYVYAVDCHVWESVARWQRSLIDRGIRPVPVSVNVSRVDFYFDDIAEHFIDLVNRYGLSPELIGVEITESAFTDNTDTIQNAIIKLHEAGFHILMDDFGSGSSSLSMLHTMNLDVLKTDVQFMSMGEQDSRAISIVESVISMAHMIGMSVVTEGVETEAQKDNLISMGDNYAQGFYFYKPMPKERFEALIANPDNVTKGYRKNKDREGSSQLRFRDMIRDGLVSETLLDNIIRAAAVYRLEEGRVTIVQMNDLFTNLTGIAAAEAGTGDFADYLPEGEQERFNQLLEKATRHQLGGSEGTVRFRRPDGVVIPLAMRVFSLYAFDKHRIFLSTVGQAETEV